MYCHIIASTGWTWEYIDDCMTVPRLRELTNYWKNNPPLHLMVAAYFGIKGKQEPAKVAQDVGDVRELLAILPVVPHQGPKPPPELLRASAANG